MQKDVGFMGITPLLLFIVLAKILSNKTYPLKMIQRFSGVLHLSASFVIDNFLDKNDTFVNSLSFFNPRKAGWLLAWKHIFKCCKLCCTKAFRGLEGGA